jgi:hypothetical protein
MQVRFQGRTVALESFKHLSMASKNSYFTSIMTSHLEAHPKAAYALCATLAILVTHYAVMRALFERTTHQKGHHKTPPVVPHFLPFIGNVPWQFVWSPVEFFKSR